MADQWDDFPAVDTSGGTLTRGSTFGWQLGPRSDPGDNGRFAGGGTSLYNPEDYAALPADSPVPFGAQFPVTNPATGATVMVTRRDIGPSRWTGRGVDLAPSAMAKLGANTDDPLIVNTSQATTGWDQFPAVNAPTAPVTDAYGQPYQNIDLTKPAASPASAEPTVTDNSEAARVAQIPSYPTQVITPTEHPLLQQFKQLAQQPSPPAVQHVEQWITQPIPGVESALNALGTIGATSPQDLAASPVSEEINKQIAGLVSPANLALGVATAGLPALAGRLVAAGFSAQAALSGAKQYQQYNQTTDPDERQRLMVDMISNGVIAGLAGAGALKGGEPARAEAPGEPPPSPEQRFIPPEEGTAQVARFQEVQTPETLQADAQRALDLQAAAERQQQAAAATEAQVPDLTQANLEIGQNGLGPIDTEGAAPPETTTVRAPITLDEIRLRRERTELQHENDIAERMTGSTHPAIDERLAEIDNQLEDMVNAAAGQRTVPVDVGGEVPTPGPTELNLQLGQRGAPAPKSVLQLSRKVGERYASQEPSTTGIPSGEVRPGVDEGASLRQQGQAAPVREGEQGAQVQAPQEPVTSAIANKFTQARIAEGELGPVEPSEGISAEGSARLGQRLVETGANDVDTAVTRVMAGKFDPINDPPVVRFEEARLRNAKDKAFDALQQDRANPALKQQYENAFNDLTDFHKGPIARLKQAFHLQGRNLQGEFPVDLSKAAGLREAWLQATGEDAPPWAQKVMEKQAGKVDRAENGVNGAAEKLNGAIDKEYARKPRQSAESVRDQILQDMKDQGAPCVLG